MAISLIKKPAKPTIFKIALLSLAVFAGNGIAAPPTDKNAAVYVIGNSIRYHSASCTYVKEKNATLKKLEDVPNMLPCQLCWRDDDERRASKNAEIERIRTLEKEIKALEKENAVLKKAETDKTRTLEKTISELTARTKSLEKEIKTLEKENSELKKAAKNR